MSGPLGSSFWRLFVSSATSNLADGIGRIALPLLGAAITRDPIAIATLGAMTFLPWLLFALLNGAIVDRSDRRKAMALANGLRALVLGALGLATLLDVRSMTLLYVVAFVVGTAETIYDSAARAILPQVVRRDQLDRGNSLLVVEESVGQIFLGGPAGSLLFAAMAAAPFFTNAAGFAIAGVLVLSLRGSFKLERSKRTTIRTDIREGLSWLWNSPFMRSLTVINAAVGVLGSMVSALLILYLLENLHLDEGGIALVLVAAGVAGILGGVLAPPLAAWLGRTTCVVGASLIGPIAIALMGTTSNAILGTAMFSVSAGLVMMWNVLTMSIRQAVIPPELFGRVQGSYRTVVWGSIPIGSVLGGVVASWTSIPAVFIVSGLLQATLAFWVWRMMRSSHDLIEAAYARV